MRLLIFMVIKNIFFCFLMHPSYHSLARSCILSQSWSPYLHFVIFIHHAVIRTSYLKAHLIIPFLMDTLERVPTSGRERALLIAPFLRKPGSLQHSCVPYLAYRKQAIQFLRRVLLPRMPPTLCLLLFFMWLFPVHLLP